MRQKSYAKVNIFLKIVGIRGNYHELLSRFVRVSTLYDTLALKKKENVNVPFELKGEFDCTLEQNTIYKAYTLLSKESPKVASFFKDHMLEVDKQIPSLAGLGGGSSNAATFLQLINQTLKLNIPTSTLASMGATIGADVPFFIYNATSANVSGIGEIVEVFEEEPLSIETFTPEIACDTAKVYQKFRSSYLEGISPTLAASFVNKDSRTLLAQHDAKELNDLFAPAIDLYPKLKHYHDKNFFSGSGSTYFRSQDG